MRVSSISVASSQRMSLYKQNSYLKPPLKQEGPKSQDVAFKGGLKLGDYIAGGICGTVFGIVATAALGPIAGIAAGLFVGKAAADANNETRKYDPNDSK